MRTEQRVKALEAAVPCKKPLTVGELHRLVAAATDINELSDEVLDGIINQAAGRPLDFPIPEADDLTDEQLDEIIARETGVVGPK